MRDPKQTRSTAAMLRREGIEFTVTENGQFMTSSLDLRSEPICEIVELMYNQQLKPQNIHLPPRLHHYTILQTSNPMFAFMSR
jgi:hypothetical protein